MVPKSCGELQAFDMARPGRTRFRPMLTSSNFCLSLSANSTSANSELAEVAPQIGIGDTASAAVSISVHSVGSNF